MLRVPGKFHQSYCDRVPNNIGASIKLKDPFFSSNLGERYSIFEPVLNVDASIKVSSIRDATFCVIAFLVCCSIPFDCLRALPSFSKHYSNIKQEGLILWETRLLLVPGLIDLWGKKIFRWLRHSLTALTVDKEVEKIALLQKEGHLSQMVTSYIDLSVHLSSKVTSVTDFQAPMSYLQRTKWSVHQVTNFRIWNIKNV